MLVLGDTYAGKTSLIRALASHYLDDHDPGRTNTVDIYGWHISANAEISFATEGKKESLRVWELAAQKFYRVLQRSLIQKDTLTLVVIDSARPERSRHALKEWSFFCKKVGISDPIIVFTKADKTDCTAELRATVQDAFFVSAKADSEELSRLRATIIRRAADSVEVPDHEAELLINAVKVLTQIDDWSVPQVRRVASSLRIDDTYLKHGIFLPEASEALLAEYSTFLLTDSSYQPLSAQDQCQLCTYEKTFVEVSQGQCLSLSHGSVKFNSDCDSLPPVELPADFHQTCAQIFHELAERRVLYPVQLPNGNFGYFFPHLLEISCRPDPILRGIKVTYSDSEILSEELADEIFDLIMKAYPLAWSEATRFGSRSGCMKSQFSVQNVEGLIKLFEFKSYVILNLPPTLNVGDLLGPRFQYQFDVEPKIGRTNHTSKKWKLVVDSKW